MPTRVRCRSSWLLAAALGVCLVAGPAPARGAAPTPINDLVGAGAIDPDVPRPESVLDHPVGADAARYDAIVRYYRALADASDRVTLTPYGETHERRTLYYLTITSAANHARLDAIRETNAKLADPRRLEPGEDVDAIIASAPAVAWLAYSIHGDEVSPADSAMVVAWLLAAAEDERTRALRDELVVHIDPLQNPDGRERYLAQIQTLRGKVDNPDLDAMHHAGLWSAGRGNHYLFDLNRDWLMQSQPETRGRIGVIRSWNPHLLVDAHEMGALSTYLFEPPREPFNVNLSERNMHWRRAASADQGRAFDRLGWSYYTGEWYEEWYPGYTNAWGNLLGAIGILYEQAGVSGDAVRQRSGNVLTYREAVAHNVVSSFANLETLHENRAAILADYAADRRWAISGDGPFHETFLFPPTADGARMRRLLDILDHHGIEHETADSELDIEDAVDIWGEPHPSAKLPAGTVIVRSTQPHRRLLHAVLGFDPRMSKKFLRDERHDLESGRGSRLYDISGWNVPMAVGLEGYAAKRMTKRTARRFPWIDRVAAAEGAAAAERDDPEPKALPDGAYGYLVPVDDSDVHRLLARLFARGAQPRIGRKPFTNDGHAYRRGAVLLRANEHDEDLGGMLREVSTDLAVTVRATGGGRSEEGPDLGGDEFVLLHVPRVAIASQWPVSTTSFGGVWHLLDARIGMRASPVNAQRLGRLDLRRYNVLIVPNSYNLDAVLGEGGARRLRTWVESGGTLIAMGGSASSLARPDSTLSSVRRYRDVLEQLDVYEEAVARELAAREPRIDIEAVWSRGIADPEPGADDPGENDAADGKRAPADAKALERADTWARRFSPQGAIVATGLDPEHWLAFGLGERLPVLLSGSTALMAKSPVATPVRLADVDHLRLSGLFWPDARARFAHSAYATVERVGNGQVILFQGDPCFRGYWDGSSRLLLNAVLLGPGMGTAQPLPW